MDVKYCTFLDGISTAPHDQAVRVQGVNSFAGIVQKYTSIGLTVPYRLTVQETKEGKMEMAEMASELEEIELELRELQEDFGDLGLDADAELAESAAASPELAELHGLILGTEFDVPVSSESNGGSTLLEIADDTSLDADAEGLLGDIGGAIGDAVGGAVKKVKRGVRNLIKRKAGKIIKKIVKLVKSASKLAKCAPSVTAAVVAFKAGKYGTALKLAYSAYKCIKKNL